jgi:membrane fusion protein (multidrug efflux system)
MFKRTIIFISVILLVLAGLGFFKYQQIQQGMVMMVAGEPPPATVEVIAAQRVKWQPRVSALGTLTAREGIDVSNEVEGIVENSYYLRPAGQGG